MVDCAKVPSGFECAGSRETARAETGVTERHSRVCAVSPVYVEFEALKALEL